MCQEGCDQCRCFCTKLDIEFYFDKENVKQKSYEQAKQAKKQTLQEISYVSERLKKPDPRDLEHYWLPPQEDYLKAKLAYLRNQLIIDDLDEFDSSIDLLKNNLVKCVEISHQILKYEFMPQMRDFCEEMKKVTENKEVAFEGDFAKAIYDQCVKFKYLAVQPSPPYKLMVNGFSLPY